MKIGIIIPYRDRKQHLEKFIPIIKDRLEKQNLKYEIIVVEQSNNIFFCRSKLLNIGAKNIYDKVDYFCFHDVDLIPDIDADYTIDNHKVIHNIKYLIDNKNHIINDNNIDVNLNLSNIEYYDLFNIKYSKKKLLGGVSIINKEIWKNNQWNEIFQGWGFEDAEYYQRLESNKISIVRKQNKYLSLYHPEYQSNNFIYEEIKLFFFIQINKILFYYSKNSRKFYIKDTDYKVKYLKKEKDYTLLSVDFDYNYYPLLLIFFENIIFILFLISFFIYIFYIY